MEHLIGLRIEASDDGGNSYSTIFSKSGDQGDQWNYETVCLGLFQIYIFKVTASVGFLTEVVPNGMETLRLIILK